MHRNRQIHTGWRVSIVTLGLMVCVLCAVANAAPPKGAPKELKLGFVDFFSGSASIFGISGKTTAEWLMDKWNKDGGIRGVPVKLVEVDEAGGPDKQVTEFRRLVLDEKVDAIVGYTSSADCLAIGPVAEELQTLTVVHICGTRRLTEGKKLQYIFRTSNHQVADSVMAARYVLSMKPDLKTVAGANEDYAWGRDSWDDFKAALSRLKPDVQFVGEVWTKIQAGEYSAEISKLLALKPDVIHSTFWGGGLVTFVQQASARELFKNSLVILPVLEQSFQDLKTETPEGVIAMPRATAGYFLHPDPQTHPSQKEFVESYKARFGRYPDYVAYRAYQAFAGLRAAYEKAMDQTDRWPKTDEVIKAFEGLTWDTPLGSVTMRADHQAVHAGIVGLSKMDPQYGFAIMDRVVELPAEQIMPPVGVESTEWLKTLK